MAPLESVQIDCEKLIEVVRNHPVLFDTSHADYMRSKMKDELWAKIDAELASNGKAVKEQWRKLRECHQEAMRRQKKKKSGDAAGRQKPWTYQSQMEFVLSYLKNRLTQSNLQTSSDSGTPIVNDCTGNAAGEEEIPPTPSKEDSSIEWSESVGDEVPPKKRKHRGEQLLLQRSIQSSERRTKHRDKLRQQIFNKELQCQQHHNDALYFLSMYATTKRLSPRYRQQVRKKVFEAVTEAEEQYEYESSPDAFSLSRESTLSTFSNPSHVPHALSQEFFQPQSSEYPAENSSNETTSLTLYNYIYFTCKTY